MSCSELVYVKKKPQNLAQMTIPELVSSLFTLCELKLPARQERMYILDNTIWFLSFVFLDFSPISLLAKQPSIRFDYCCIEGKIPAYLKKTIGLSIKKKLNLVIPLGN